MADYTEYQRAGERLLTGPEHACPALPLKPWSDFDLRFAFEVPAHRFEAELGFWAPVAGLRFLSVDRDYAVCSDAGHTCTFAFRRAPEPIDLGPFRIQWFTGGLDGVLKNLASRDARLVVVRHSPVQRDARLVSPSGLPVEF